MAMVATRHLSVQGQSYQRGDPVDAAAFSSEKAEQLLALRILENTGAHAPRICVALRSVSIGGRAYKRGAVVDVSGVPAGKVSQLLEHRVLDLAPESEGKSVSRRRRE